MAASAFCPSCGAPVDPGAPTCPFCAAALTDAVSPAPGTPEVGPGPAATGATGPAPRSGAGGGLVPLVLVVAGVALALVAVLLVRAEDGGTDAATGEVFLEAADAPGSDAFTEAVDPTAPASTAVSPPVSGPLPTVAAAVVPVSGTAPAPGSPPYGGSGDDTVCDREKLVTFLTAQPDRARAWAGVLGVEVADLPTYVRSLTPTVLLYDTRVTNHGFRDGRATPRQSVLQAGTAVLVDAQGDPVVRCRCGNPLLPPTVLSSPRVVGTPWPGYRPAALVRVEAGVTVTVTVTGGTPTTTATTGGGGTGGTSSTAQTSTTGSSSTTGTTGPTTATTAGITPEDRDAAEGLIAAVSECRPADQVTLVDVEPLEGFTGGFTITLDVGGTRMLFVYEPATGTITEGDRASADLIAECGIR